MKLTSCLWFVGCHHWLVIYAFLRDTNKWRLDMKSTCLKNIYFLFNQVVSWHYTAALHLDEQPRKFNILSWTDDVSKTGTTHNEHHNVDTITALLYEWLPINCHCLFVAFNLIKSEIIFGPCLYFLLKFCFNEDEVTQSDEF